MDRSEDDAVRGLEIGGGPSPQHPEFEQFDAIDWHERTGLSYTLGDARKLPYEANAFDTVVANNLLEHFPPTETTKVLKEWVRVLRVHGQLRLVVPDSMGILRDHFSGTNTWEECEERLRGSRDYPGNEHFAAFTLYEFQAVIDRVPGLTLIFMESSHRGGGITSISIKEG